MESDELDVPVQRPPFVESARPHLASMELGGAMEVAEGARSGRPDPEDLPDEQLPPYTAIARPRLASTELGSP